ncbi:hypothetical protein NQ317_007954, partial [Molorchus minor]
STLAVEILSSNNPLSADRRYEIPLPDVRLRPPAKITWLIDGKELKPSKDNFTQSRKFSIHESDILHKKKSQFIKRRSLMSNIKSDRDAIAEKCEINHRKRIETFCVSDVPILHLSLGSNLNPEDIEEGDDVYFECKVDANPLAYKSTLEAQQQGPLV